MSIKKIQFKQNGEQFTDYSIKSRGYFLKEYETMLISNTISSIYVNNWQGVQFVRPGQFKSATNSKYEDASWYDSNWNADWMIYDTHINWHHNNMHIGSPGIQGGLAMSGTHVVNEGLCDGCCDGGDADADCDCDCDLGEDCVIF